MRPATAFLLPLLLVGCADMGPTTPEFTAENPLFRIEAALSHQGDRTYDFTTLDLPGARGATANGVSAGGDIVGAYIDNGGVQHGFLLRNGEMTTIDFPGARGTDARGIGPGGEIVGGYWLPGEPAGNIHGYRLTPQGDFQAADYPGHINTIPQRILPDGSILGCRHDNDTMGSMRGVVMGRFGNEETDLFASMHNGATPDLRRIAGLYTNTSAGRTEGYVIDDGVFAPVVVPGSTLTAAWDVNPAGEVVGVYRTGLGTTAAFHGFVLTAAGYVPIDFPGATHTRAFGTNARGDVVGHYVAGGRVFAYLARRTAGS